MKNSLFTILFMVIITIVFISALAFINESSKDRIARNLEIEKFKSILYAFNILPTNVDESEMPLNSTISDIPWSEEFIFDNIKSQIKKIKLALTDNQKTLLRSSYLSWQDSVELFIRYEKNNNIIAYGFPLRGKGLWGTITAFGVISADFTKMVGIDFTDQVETPGLGARITETEFKYFFRKLDLSKFQQPAISEPYIIMVNKKTQSNVEQSENSLQAITGATLTCHGVLNMMNTDMRFYIKVLKENEQIIKKKLM